MATKEVTKTPVKGTKPVDKKKAADDQQAEAEMNAVSEDVTNALSVVADLSWDDRKDFHKKYLAAFNNEADLRSGGNEFDTAAYTN